MTIINYLPLLFYHLNFFINMLTCYSYIIQKDFKVPLLPIRLYSCYLIVLNFFTLVLLSFSLIIYIIFLLFHNLRFNLEHFYLNIIYKDIFRISFKLNSSNNIHI